MKGTKITLTPKQEAWLVKHFKNTKNDVLMEKLGLKFGTFHRIVRSLGLKKTKQFMRKCQTATTAAAKASHIANGTYPPKGYVIPRSEEFRFQKGVTNRQRLGERKNRERIEKAAAKRRQTFREERARAHFGLPRKTRLRVVRQPRKKTLDRYYLKKLGYIIDDANLIAYWTPETTRAVRLEAKPRRYYKFAEYGNV